MPLLSKPKDILRHAATNRSESANPSDAPRNTKRFHLGR